VEPKGTKYESILDLAPDVCQQKGLKWTSRHKGIYIRPVNPDWQLGAVDGINGAGLTASLLYLPGYAVYPNATEENCKESISQVEVVGYILATFETVAEVKEAIESNTFPNVVGLILMGMVHPFHYGITDKSGAAIVLEYTVAGRKVHDNTAGVMTNSPPYDYHMTNLKQYVNLQNKSQPERKYYDSMSNEHVLPLLPASGLLGMPGDYTSPSRFIRAATLVRYAQKPKNVEEAIISSFHILNSVDVIVGTVEGRFLPEHTYWHLVKDLKNGCLYYRTYDFLSIRKLCLPDVPDYHSYFLLNKNFKNFDESVEDVASRMIPIKTEL